MKTQKKTCINLLAMTSMTGPKFAGNLFLFGVALRTIGTSLSPGVPIREEPLKKSLHQQQRQSLRKHQEEEEEEEEEEEDISLSFFNDNDKFCFTTECLDEFAIPIARSFPDRFKAEWCTNSTKQNNKNDEEGGKKKQGLIMVKVAKSASSTSAGVTLRIAKNNGCKEFEWEHRHARYYQKRDRDASFMFAPIRRPTARAISWLFFKEVSINQEEPTEDWLVSQFRNFNSKWGSIADGQGGFTLQYTSLNKIKKYEAWSPAYPTKVRNPNQVVANVKDVIDNYDFLLVVERMDESLVALALVMGLELGDVLVTASKVGGSNYFYSFSRENTTCVPIAKSFITPAMKNYLASDEWLAQNYGDLLLHAAANRSLDLTIERLGKERFQRELTEFQRLTREADELCAPLAEGPCSSEGKVQVEFGNENCYERDFGCGYRCIDRILEEDKLYQSKATNANAFHME